MLIRDLEFFDCNADYSSSALKGGAAAVAYSDVSTSYGGVYATATAEAAGDITNSKTVTGAVYIVNDYYTAGYGIAYGTAYAVDTYGYSAATDISHSSGVV